jgi:hypothetical protein
MLGKAKVIVHGSSHFTERRLFPKFFENAIDEHPNNLTARYYKPYISALGGATLTDVLKDTIISKMKKCTNEEKECLFIINLGDNDIRKALLKEQVLTNLVAKYTEICRNSTKYSKVAVVGWVPSPDTHEETYPFFKKVITFLSR